MWYTTINDYCESLFSEVSSTFPKGLHTKAIMKEQKRKKKKEEAREDLQICST